MLGREGPLRAHRARRRLRAGLGGTSEQSGREHTVSTTPSGPPPSGPPKGPPSSSGSSGPPGGPPSGGGAPGGASGDGFQLNRNQLIAIVAVIAVLLGVLVGVVAGGGGGKSDEEAAKEKTIKLEPISSTGSNPFSPPVSPKDSGGTPPSTITPPATGNTPFGGTGDNTLCDREQLISFLTDPSHSAQAREWARVVGISVSEIPTYIRDLIPTTLANDTRVTNHTFKNGRAVPLQSVLQAGTAVLVDQYGRLVARCRCGNPLLEPEEVRGPIYSGPKWPGFDPTVIVIINVSPTPVFPKGGVPSGWRVIVGGTATNLQGSQDSTTQIRWDGSIEISNGAITGSGTGTGTFDGGCYSESTGEFVGDWVQEFSFSVTVTGTASETGELTLALTPSASGFAITSSNVGGSGPIADDCRTQAADPSGASTFLADAFGAVEIPSRQTTTPITSGEFELTYTLCPVTTSHVQLVGISCSND